MNTSTGGCLLLTVGPAAEAAPDGQAFCLLGIGERASADTIIRRMRFALDRRYPFNPAKPFTRPTADIGHPFANPFANVWALRSRSACAWRWVLQAMAEGWNLAWAAAAPEPILLLPPNAPLHSRCAARLAGDEGA